MILPSKKQLYGWILFTAITIIACILFVVFDWSMSLLFDMFIVLLLVWVIVLVASIPFNYLLSNELPIKITRETPKQLSVGKTAITKLYINNISTKSIYIQLADLLPSSFIGYNEFTKQTLMPNSQRIFIYSFKPMRRGSYEYHNIQIRFKSFLGLWLFDKKVECASEVKVYPDFSAFSNQGQISSDITQHAGTISRQQKRGLGTDFEQLRDYRAGDAMYQIDHKATSKFNHLISREYQIERDQQVILLLDCSRRMRVFQDDFSHFDYALNAAVYLSRTILQQGDGVGLMSFGNSDSDSEQNLNRFCPPKKGRHNINYLLNQIYDIEPSMQSPDYVQAAEQLLLKQPRRSLIILMTNLREEDSEQIISFNRLLSRKHMLVVANLSEEVLSEHIDINSFDDAVYFASRDVYRQQRKKMLSKLDKEKMILLDTNPKNLSSNLINLYLNVKQSGAF